jgi:hypothetical protein
MQHEDERLLGNHDRGEFDAFLRQTERELSAPKPADLVLDDSVWKRFVKEVECESAARELGIEIDASTHERLRSQRPDHEADFLKSAGAGEGRRRAVLRQLMNDLQEHGEMSEQSAEALRSLLVGRR